MEKKTPYLGQPQIHLRKLLQLFYLPDGRVRTILRQDVQGYIKKQKSKEPTPGMDFYGAFWGDAKEHIEGDSDLTEKTQERIRSNRYRKNLYPKLAAKFLEWLNEKKRWTNEGISISPHLIFGKMIEANRRDFSHVQLFCCLPAAMTGNDHIPRINQNRIVEPEFSDAGLDLIDLFAGVSPGVTLVRF